MFTTFYSYKGGVGRSMALANVAWLLSNHQTEPARVLAIDFDLNAPGLHKVLNMREDHTSLGIVDFIDTFITNARVDDIYKYIHPSHFPNIDVIPAGLFDEYYKERLEGINWKDLYESAHGYELINKFKAMIAQVKPAYDYVLIDSLTGYSDVGGICVRQLPDCVVLLFRLNNQNLDGIKSVYKSIRSPENAKCNLPVIPVITPAWPFRDSEAESWYEKARTVFPAEKLDQISFDGGLSFGENIVSQSRSSDLRLTVISDYENLALRLRSVNDKDPLTMWNSLKDEDSVLAADSLGKYQRLLSLRSTNGEYWHFLPHVAFRSRSYGLTELSHGRSTPLQDFGTFVDDQCKLDNKYALVARARYAKIWNPKVKEPNPHDIDRALDIDPLYVEALMTKGQYLQKVREFEGALRCFRSALHALAEKDKRRGRILEVVGAASLDVRDGESAVSCYTEAIALDGRDPDLYAGRARAYYLLGRFEAALSDVETFRSISGGQDELTGELLPIQILAAMGREDEAKDSLKKILASRKRNRLLNTAEAYLAVSPEMTIEILDRSSKRSNDSPVSTLRIVAEIFLGRKNELSPQDTENILREKNSKSISWNSLDLHVITSSALTRGRITKEQGDLVLRVLEIMGPMMPTLDAI